MPDPAPYAPDAVFGGAAGARRRALIAPARYVQGPGVLDDLGGYLAPLGASSALLLLSPGGWSRFGERLRASLASAGVEPVAVTFGGESSQAAAEEICEQAREGGGADVLVAVGGGKCADAGRMAAHRLGIPAVVCPTLASTDAPCSALSVVYTEEGVSAGVEFFPRSPALVAVDTAVVAESPARYTVSGMGDALATWYEARTCHANPDARSVLGARPTITAAALGELCARTLYEDGVDAARAAARGEVTESLERVVEANTLLSGVGFESGGIAAAHCIAAGLTAVDSVRENFLHGEMVAIGLLAQLVMEGTPDEARRAASFCGAVGLPAHLGQIGLAPSQESKLATVAEAAMAVPFVHNEPFPVSADGLRDALREAHALGAEVVGAAGDAAYRALHDLPLSATPR